MDIDIKRLEWDAAYWDEVAPDGCFWARIGNGKLRGWQMYEFGDEGILGCTLVPRPKPQSHEWDGEGDYPPLGTRFKVALGRGEDDLTELVVTAVGRKRLLAIDPTYDEREWVLGKDCEFHTIRPQAERERDELAKLCDEYIKRDDYGHNLADAIIASGWKKYDR